MLLEGKSQVSVIAESAGRHNETYNFPFPGKLCFSAQHANVSKNGRMNRYVKKSLRLATCSPFAPVWLHKLKFRFFHNYYPNIQSPLTFSEKLLKRILEERDPYYPVYANKLLAPLFVKELQLANLHINSVLGVTSKLDRGFISELPNQFVLKLSYGSGRNLIVNDKKEVDFDSVIPWFNKELRRVRNAQMFTNPYCAVFAEPLLVSNQQLPADYKFHCFNSKKHGFNCIFQVDIDRFSNHRRNIYDSNCNLLNMRWCDSSPEDQPHRLPSNIEEMLSIAKRISERFSYIRVDLYSLNNQIYFGELTPFHQGGMQKFADRNWDIKLGEMWDYP